MINLTQGHINWFWLYSLSQCIQVMVVFLSIYFLAINETTRICLESDICIDRTAAYTTLQPVSLSVLLCNMYLSVYYHGACFSQYITWQPVSLSIFSYSLYLFIFFPVSCISQYITLQPVSLSLLPWQILSLRILPYSMYLAVSYPVACISLFITLVAYISLYITLQPLSLCILPDLQPYITL